MDVLSQALLAVRATGAIFFQVECNAPWGFAVPDVNEVAHLLSPGTERLINYHLVTQGSALVRMQTGEDFHVAEGDIVILPHGDAHTVSNGAPNHYADSAGALGQVIGGRPATLRLGGDDGEPTRIICGFIGCERAADRLFLRGLPQLMRIGLRDEPGDKWLSASVEHLVLEAQSDKPGAAILLSKMAESLFVEALRRFMRDLPPDQTGWLASARDPVVGAALAALHDRPQHGWTLNELAREAGASRSVMSRRFSQLTGEPPMSYLRRWRLQLAAGLLQNSDDTILRIASGVGYESEAAFNRAFKVEFGLPPAQYRRRATRV